MSTKILCTGVFAMAIAHAAGGAPKVHCVAPSADTFIASDLLDQSMGGVTSVYLGRCGKGRIARMLLLFDVTGYAGAIDKVLLRLSWRIYLWWDAGNVIRVHRVLRPWGEGTGQYGMAEGGEATRW